LAVCVSSCLENEEEITVRPDGSVSVRMSAHGKPDDLADGYPISLDAPWIGDSETTATWLRDVGRDTGSARVRENLRQLAPGSNELTTDDDVVVAVRADFRSASDMPRWMAPDSEPYRTAYLERSTDLHVETKSGRRVYTFERVFRGRSFDRFSLWERLKQRMPAELQAKMDQLDQDDSLELTLQERDRLIDILTTTLTDTAMAHADSALLSVYTAGDASLDPRAVQRVLDSARESLATVVGREAIAPIVATFLAAAKANSKGDEAFVALAQLESRSRESVRSSLDAALARDGVPLPTRNAIRGQLEWTFTALDHTSDLGDESFEVTVHMPGIVVGGNFDEREDATVRWSFEGEGLNDRDRVLRVVSVVD
jgi:hypothetical protein